MERIVEAGPLELEKEILALWKACLGPSFPLDEALFRQNVRPEEEAQTCLAIFAGAREKSGVERGGRGRLEGFALVKRGFAEEGHLPDLGNLSLIAVAEERRGLGIGAALLRRAEAWLGLQGAKGMRIGADRRHFFPGAPTNPAGPPSPFEALLDAKGYAKEGLEHDLIGPAIAATEILDEPLPRGLSWSFAEGELHHSASGFFRKNFPGRWRSEFEDFAASGTDPRDLIFLLSEGGIAGFCRICRGEGGTRQPGLYWRALLGEAAGALGPIGVDADFRGRGLGLSLLRQGLRELGRRGATTVVIDWTDLVDFYAALGFKVWKSYRSRSKLFA